MITGILAVLHKLCDTKQLDFVEAEEYIEDPYKCEADYPYRSLDTEERGRKRKKETQKKGKKRPKHSSSVEKFTEKNLPKKVDDFLNELAKKFQESGSSAETASSFKKLTSLSLARNTWQRYGSALGLFEKFQKEREAEIKEWNGKEKIEFLCWAEKDTKLSPQTIALYFSAINKLFEMFAMNEKEDYSSIQKTILKGLRNKRAKYSCKQQKKSYSPLTLEILIKVRKFLKNAKESKTSKQSLWTACVTAFWGCFRLREIVCKTKHRFDRFSDLTWEDIKFGKEWVSIMLKSPKAGKPIKVVLGSIAEKKLCPRENLKKLKKVLKRKGIFEEKLPVFRTGTGRNLRPKDLVACLDSLKLPRKSFSGKSFRAGIPNCLTKGPEKFEQREIKSKGRWKSQAYKSYLHEENLDLDLYKKVADFLLKNCKYVQERRRRKPADWPES
jgi:hypothetical protein